MTVMSTQETADYLKVKIKTLYQWVQQERIPFRRVTGKRCLFVKEAIDEWLSGNDDLAGDMTKYPSLYKKVQ